MASRILGQLAQFRRGMPRRSSSFDLIGRSKIGMKQDESVI